MKIEKIKYVMMKQITKRGNFFMEFIELLTSNIFTSSIFLVLKIISLFKGGKSGNTIIINGDVIISEDISKYKK